MRQFARTRRVEFVSIKHLANLFICCNSPPFFSAREDFGVRCIIAPSFGEIFRNNCLQNCMLPIELSVDECRELARDAEAGVEFAVDLEREEIMRGEKASPIRFTTDPFRRECLLNGFDDIAATLRDVDAIAAFEQRRTAMWPWLDGAAGEHSTGNKVGVKSSGKETMEW